MDEELKGELQDLLEAYADNLHQTREEHTIKLQNLVYSMRSFLHTHDTLQVITNKHDRLLENLSRFPSKETTDE